jgi:hypothetical protein
VATVGSIFMYYLRRRDISGLSAFLTSPDVAPAGANENVIMLSKGVQECLRVRDRILIVVVGTFLFLISIATLLKLTITGNITAECQCSVTPYPILV